MTSPNDIMNGKPILPTAPKLIIRKSIRIQSIVDFVKRIHKKKYTWQKFDFNSIPNHSAVALKWSDGSVTWHIKYLSGEMTGYPFEGKEPIEMKYMH